MNLKDTTSGACCALAVPRKTNQVALFYFRIGFQKGLKSKLTLMKSKLMKSIALLTIAMK